MASPRNLRNNNKSGYLSPVGAWALAFGCAVGWGAFMMPGTTFLPMSGPLGSVLGLMIGGIVMLIIGKNYSILMNRYPGPGGSYSYAKTILGVDHGFLCSWMLVLTYIAVIWANSTAFSLVVRFFFGDIFCFGFSYTLAGYTVYFGEILLSFAMLSAACLVCLLGKNVAKWVMIICAMLLFGGICVCFIALVVKNGGFSLPEPLFAQKLDPAVQIFAIMILAPWAYVGFESIAHSSGEFRFSVKRSLPVMLVAIVTAALAYIMLTVCAASFRPDGYSSWVEYISSLSQLNGIDGVPTFYAAHEVLGRTGTFTIAIAVVCGIITGVVGNYIALSRLMYSMSSDSLMPRSFSKKNSRGVPWVAIVSVAGVSCLVPFLGRTAIGWIVDVTTIGAIIVYAYISVCVITLGRREKKPSLIIWGACAALISLVFAVFFLIPSTRAQGALSIESFLILIIWCIIGMLLFRILVQRDVKRIYGKSGVVWFILFVLILMVSVSWLHRTMAVQMSDITRTIEAAYRERAVKAGVPEYDIATAQAEDEIEEIVTDFAESMRNDVFVQLGLLVSAFAVIFSIFSLLRKREKEIENERLRAEESNRAKSVFLSNMSHDIRTPMNAVTGYTALALKEEGVPPIVRDYLEKIDHSGRYLLTLINDILDMSRIESGKFELNTSAENLCHLLDEASLIFAVQMKSKGLDYQVDYSSVRDRYVICDSHYLNRILLNLISNAFKFTPEGGSIRVELIQTGKEDGAGSYEFSVADTGIGMSPEFAAHVFDAFERERTQAVSSQQGTGLGMAIAKSLVEIMGGTIRVETEQGKGTKFIINVSFPLTTADSVSHAVDTPIDRPTDFSGVRLLLVEDNMINREIACAILGQEKFIVDTAENGKVAVEMIESADPDTYALILMDVQMPVMNGYEAAKEIRRMGGKRAKLPIIAVTANTFESDRKEAAEAGMNAHVSKPFDPDELVRVIADNMI